MPWLAGAAPAAAGGGTVAAGAGGTAAAGSAAEAAAAAGTAVGEGAALTAGTEAAHGAMLGQGLQLGASAAPEVTNMANALHMGGSMADVAGGSNLAGQLGAGAATPSFLDKLKTDLGSMMTDAKEHPLKFGAEMAMPKPPGAKDRPSMAGGQGGAAPTPMPEMPQAGGEGGGNDIMQTINTLLSAFAVGHQHGYDYANEQNKGQ